MENKLGDDMQILISLHYFANGVKSLQSGYFKVNAKKFSDDPDQEATRVTYEWFKQVKREHIYEVTLHKALYNEIDITEELRGMAKVQPGG